MKNLIMFEAPARPQIDRATAGIEHTREGGTGLRPVDSRARRPCYIPQSTPFRSPCAKPGWRGRSGFTLVEIMVSSALSTMLAATVFVVFSHSARLTRAGGYQVQFTSTSRIVSQKLVDYIEQGKAVGVSGAGLDIVTVDLQMARIYFDSGDGNTGTVADNRLVYDPNISAAGDEKILCRYVSPLQGEPMFSIVPSTPNSARLTFHVGDGTNVLDASFSGTGRGYQGVEVRISATPRNMQRWYD